MPVVRAEVGVSGLVGILLIEHGLVSCDYDTRRGNLSVPLPKRSKRREAGASLPVLSCVKSSRS